MSSRYRVECDLEIIITGFFTVLLLTVNVLKCIVYRNYTRVGKSFINARDTITSTKDELFFLLTNPSISKIKK